MALKGLTGKAAVVTGGAGGIGSAVCRRLAEEGAKVTVVDLDEAAAKEVASSLGPGAIGVGADVATEEGTDAYVRAALGAFGRIDAFHNNAGIEGRVAPLVEAEVADFDRVVAVNVRGVFLGLRAVLRQMATQGGGAIVNTASVAGLRGAATLGPYVASKHAVVGLTRTAAAEAGPQGVRVNAVCPGLIDTRMLRSIEEARGPTAGADAGAAKAASVRRVPQARYGEPDEVAALVAWLLSEEAPYAHGGIYTLDGGLTA